MEYKLKKIVDWIEGMYLIHWKGYFDSEDM